MVLDIHSTKSCTHWSNPAHTHILYRKIIPYRLFPNLSQVYCILPPYLDEVQVELPAGFEVQAPDGLVAVLGPSIKSLTVIWPISESSFEVICEAILQSCPHLEFLDCRDNLFSGHLLDLKEHFPVPSFSALIMGLRSLRGICWEDFSLSDIAVQYISKSGLRRLNLGMNVDRFAQALGNPSAAVFLDLEDLELKVSDLGRAVFNLLRVIPSSPLRNLSLRYHSQMIPEERDVCRFSQSLATSPWKHSLHTLNLQAPTDWSLSSNSTTSIIRSLLMLSNIEVIHLDMTMVAGLDNTLLNDIAHAWPRLSKLQFRAPWGPAGHQWRATLDGLVPIVQHCPRLEQLDLCLHAVTSSLLPSQRLEQRPINKSIEYLNWGHSTIKNPAEAASFLLDVFPNLISVNVRATDRLVVAKWEEVRRLIAEKRKESLDALV